MSEDLSITPMKRLAAGTTSRLTAARGLALLDVLIGMAIFALIAVTAVVGLGKFRADGFETQATSDVLGLGQAIEAQMNNGGLYPEELGGTESGGVETVAVTLPATGFDLAHILTKGHALGGYNYVLPNAATGAPAGFQVCTQHKASGTTFDAYAVYDSLKGGVVKSDTKGGCAASGYTFP